MGEHAHKDEEMSRQIQSAIAPLTAIINEMRNEIRAIRAENKEFRDIITGARFLASTGKAVLGIGAIIAMFWAFFLVITHQAK